MKYLKLRFPPLPFFDPSTDPKISWDGMMILPRNLDFTALGPIAINSLFCVLNGYDSKRQ